MSASRNAAEATAQPFGRSYGGSAAENYERFFVPAIAAPLAEILVSNAGLRAGERVLDVACGTGVVARLAAQRVGSTGAVTGIDVNPAMLEVARAVTPVEAGISWQQAGAEQLPLPDESFDVVFCQVSLQFIDDKAAALREMRRVLVPGGRLHINVPGRVPPMFAMLGEALATHIDPALQGFVLHVFSMADPGEHERLLREAGFRDVAVTATEYPPLRLPPPREFLWQYVYSTPLAATVSQVDDDRREALERAVVERWRSFVDDGGMIYRQEIVDAAGRR